MAGYIPQRDSLLSPWLTNFSALITASPATYGLLAGDATTIAAGVAAYIASYNLAIAPATRTPTNIAAKDTQKATTLATIRPYAQNVSLNAGVSPANKISLGLNPRTNTPSPIPAPTTLPVLVFQSALANSIIVRYRDALASPSVKSKPPGAVFLELHGLQLASGTPTSSVDTWPVINLSTKSPIQIPTGAMTSGASLWLGARWTTRRGLVGNFGTLISATIP